MQAKNNKRVFKTGATKNISTGKGRYDLIPTEALVALAKRFEFGVLNGHEENGYRKGIPNSVLFDSAFRHLVQAESGCTNEDHLAAAMWNISVLIFNRDCKKNTIAQALSVSKSEKDCATCSACNVESGYLVCDINGILDGPVKECEYYEEDDNENN